MDILEFLREDHDYVRGMLSEIDAMKPMKGEEQGGRLDELFGKLRETLELHTRGEEQFFYPVLKGYETLHMLIMKSIEEHHVVKIILNELGGMPKDEQWFAKFAVLKENVENHIDDEEEDIFSEADALLLEDQREEMGRNITAMERKESTAAR